MKSYDFYANNIISDLTYLFPRQQVSKGIFHVLSGNYHARFFQMVYLAL
jgi:hypothetical protein